MHTGRKVLRSSTALCVLGALALWLGCASITPAEHYRLHQDWESLRIVLSEQVKPGDSIETVRALLGTKTYESESHRAGLQVTAKSYPQDFPEGLKDSDTVLFYPHDQQGLIPLIFRDGKLANYSPRKYGLTR